jgi:hypothetical protein
MLGRARIVAAAIESAGHASRRSNCLMGFNVTGLADSRGTFCPTRPLSSCYVDASAADPDMEEWAKAPDRLSITSSVLTSDACLAAIRARDAAKEARPPRRRGRRLAREVAELPHDPDTDNDLVEDMALFNGFAVVAARALPPDPADDLEDA